MPRRVVIASPCHATHGGVETIINDLCLELPGRNWEPILALGRGARFNDVERYRQVHPGLPIVEIDGTKGTGQGRLEALSALVSKLNPDVLLSFRVFDACHAATLAKRCTRKLRFAIAIRGYEPHYIFDAGLYRGSIDLCVVDGNLLRAAVQKIADIDPQRVVSIPGGVRPPVRSRALGSANRQIRVGYVGRFAQSDKRVMDVVELVGILYEQGVPFSLHMVGAGPEEEALRAKLVPFVERGMVSFAGWKTTDQLYSEVYPNLDCVINFSPAEGVTIAPREAMAHGVVPVMSEFLGLRSEGLFVHEVNALTFPIGDIEMAALHIKRLKEDCGLLERLSENAIGSQRGIYSFDGAMDLWANSLNQCVELPALVGAVPPVPLDENGRLSRMGFSPWWAQRIRNLLGSRPIYNDPGSEWPTGSGLMTSEDAEKIMDFARDFDTTRAG